MAKIAVVAGGYLGDEGKGKITNYYLAQYNMQSEVLCIRAGGGTNTGATVYRGDKKFKLHMLPIGVMMGGGKHGYIGNGVYINPDIMVEELKLMSDNMDHHEGRRIRKLYVSKYAHVVTKDCLEEDERKERKQNLGSTKNGVSVTAARKYRYEGKTLEDYLKRPGSGKLSTAFKVHHVEVVDPYEFFTNTVIPNEWSIVLEGTQGLGLDVNHGFQYPFVSAGSFSTYGLLDGVGYALAPDEVAMCLKSYGSYFGPPRMGELDFEDDDFRKFAGEYGTTTKRPRNLCWLSSEYLKRSAQLIQPTTVVVNHLDTLNWFADNNKTWSIYIDGKPMSFEDRAHTGRKLTNAGSMFLEAIAEITNCRKILYGIGPTSYDIRTYK